MAIYYYEDQNGKYSSHTDARRFSRVSGKEAYAYLKSAEGKTRRFMKSNDYEDGGEDVFIEIPAKFIRDYRQGERREQYVNDIREDAGCTEISLYAMQGSVTVRLRYSAAKNLPRRSSGRFYFSILHSSLFTFH